MQCLPPFCPSAVLRHKLLPSDLHHRIPNKTRRIFLEFVKEDHNYRPDPLFDSVRGGGAYYGPAIKPHLMSATTVPTSQDQNTVRGALASLHLLSNGSVRSSQPFFLKAQSSEYMSFEFLFPPCFCSLTHEILALNQTPMARYYSENEWLEFSQPTFCCSALSKSPVT